MYAALATDPTFRSLDGLGELLPRLARRWSDRVALVTDSRTLTYSDLDLESSRIASVLHARGIRPGDRVALYSQNRWEWLAAFHGVLKLGAVANPLNVMLTAEEVAYVLRDAGTKALLASGERLESLGDRLDVLPQLETVLSFDEKFGRAEAILDVLAALPDTKFEVAAVDPDSLACIAYTSGTTGHPKGAMQSQRSLVLNYAYTATMHGRVAEDVVVTALPAPHVYGSVVIHSTFMAGGRVVLQERFDADDMLRAVERYGATMVEGVPAMFAMMLASPLLGDVDLSSLTRCTVGGQTIAESVIDEWERRTSVPLIEVWGMTELSGLGTTHPIHAPNVHGSIGVAYPGVEVRVADLEDEAIDCAQGERGQLMIRGPIVTMGYFNNPDATAEAITPDGWLRTGDVATHDGSGRFFVVDRLKELILTGGYNVYPSEIERVLMGHDSVALVGVARELNEVLGEVAHAYVVLAPGHHPDEGALLAYCREHLAAYKVPRAVHFVETLPTTSSGKLMRRKFSESVTS